MPKRAAELFEGSFSPTKVSRETSDAAVGEQSALGILNTRIGADAFLPPGGRGDVQSVTCLPLRQTISEMLAVYVIKGT
jgi:hypothetical protein